MLFYQVSSREAKRIKYSLHDFMAALGTLVNNEKSSIFIFNTSMNIQTFLARLMSFGIGSLSIKYLGMPLAFNSLKKSCWQTLLQKIQMKFNNLAFRALNLEGRKNILKVFLQSIPIYELLGMVVPKNSCSKMVDIFKKFLWGGAQQLKKWALFSWPKLMKPNMEGGLSI